MNLGGLGSADFNKYLAQLALPHTVKIAVSLLTNEEEILVSFDAGRGGGRRVVVTDGQVDMAGDGRMLSLTVSDPDHDLLIGQDANYTDRMLQVSYGVDVPALAKTVWINVFTGPIVSAPRQGDVIQFTCHGKERFAKHGIPALYTIKKGTKKTTAIRQMLTDLCGEKPSHLGNVPDLNPLLTSDLVLRIDNRPWQKCLELARDLGRFMAYDGSGDMQMPRNDQTTPVYTFVGGLNGPGVIGSPPEVVTDWTLIKNAVRVTGGSTKTVKAPVAYAYADPANPFSGQRLGRNGVPLYYWDIVVMNSVHTVALAQTHANAILARDIVANTSVKIETIPMPCFDFGDLVSIESVGVAVQSFLRNSSLPLNVDSGQTMSIGWNQRVSSDVFARRAS